MKQENLHSVKKKLTVMMFFFPPNRYKSDQVKKKIDQSSRIKD